MNTTKQAFLNGKNVTITNHETGTVITVERAGHNRFYISYNGVIRVVPFLAAYQVIIEASVASIEHRNFTYMYIPTKM